MEIFGKQEVWYVSVSSYTNRIDVDLKKAAKMFANRFACGSSVAKNNQNQDEIVVQGDFSDEIHDLILANWPKVGFCLSIHGWRELIPNNIHPKVPEDNIDLVEEKKKKK